MPIPEKPARPFFRCENYVDLIVRTDPRFHYDDEIQQKVAAVAHKFLHKPNTSSMREAICSSIYDVILGGYRYGQVHYDSFYHPAKREPRYENTCPDCLYLGHGFNDADLYKCPRTVLGIVEKRSNDPHGFATPIEENIWLAHLLQEEREEER